MLDRVIQLGVKIHRYRAQKEPFEGGKGGTNVAALAKWHQVQPGWSKLFIRVLAETNQKHAVGTS